MDEEKWIQIIDSLFSSKLDAHRVCVAVSKRAPEAFIEAVKEICPEAIYGDDQEILDKPNKIEAIKAHRAKYGSSLRDAKEWADVHWVKANPSEYPWGL